MSSSSKEEVYDVAVLGAGIQGSATAWYLRKKCNKKVVLIEQVGHGEVKHFRRFILLYYFYSRREYNTQLVKGGHDRRLPPPPPHTHTQFSGDNQEFSHCIQAKIVSVIFCVYVVKSSSVMYCM